MCVYIKNIFLYSINNTLRPRPDCVRVCVRFAPAVCERVRKMQLHMRFCTHTHTYTRVSVCVQHLTAAATASCNKLYTKRRQSNGKIFARHCNATKNKMLHATGHGSSGRAQRVWQGQEGCQTGQTSHNKTAKTVCKHFSCICHIAKFSTPSLYIYTHIHIHTHAYI